VRAWRGPLGPQSVVVENGGLVIPYRPSAEPFKKVVCEAISLPGERSRGVDEVLKRWRELRRDTWLGASAGDQPFVVLGDMNDYLQTDEQGSPGIEELVGWDQVENVVERLSEDERWTHYLPRGNDYKQLDYLLLSKSLAEASTGDPEIMRKGQPLRATRYTGERFVGVGQDRPKASDHCPVVMKVEVAA
jgi:hypothetical protein